MKTKAINSDTVQYLKFLLPKERKIIDLSLQGNWILAILDNGLHVKIKN